MDNAKTPLNCTGKGISLKALPEDFTVLDIETTGLNAARDKIIEIAALRVRSGKIVAEYSTLINPCCAINPWISGLTGITNEMVASAPTISEVIFSAREFIGSDIILGHNVSFDIGFIYNACANNCAPALFNDYVDTLRISRRVLPNLPHHRLKDLVEYFNITVENAHRAAEDCIATLKCYYALRESISKAMPLNVFCAAWNGSKSASASHSQMPKAYRP